MVVSGRMCIFKAMAFGTMMSGNRLDIFEAMADYG